MNSTMSPLSNSTLTFAYGNVTLPSYRAPGIHPITSFLSLLLVITCVLVYGVTNFNKFYAKMRRETNRFQRKHEFLSRTV